MSNQYVAWVSTKTGAAFFNPVGMVSKGIGQEVNDHIVVALGDLAAVEAVVAAINATLPPVPAFGELD